MAIASVRKSQQLTRAATTAWWLSPPLLILLLAWPSFKFTFLFDDFDFITRARHFSWVQLLPEPSSAFYRPLSRELYFALLARVGGSPLWAHLFNAAGIIATVVLLTRFASRIAGRRAGLFSGVFFALLAPLPMLVGWASGAQDVLAMAFVMAALNCRLEGRTGWAFGFSAAAILSKETSVLLLPVLAGLPWILGSAHRNWARDTVAWSGLALAWVALHPRVQALLSNGLVGGESGYLGWDNPDRWKSAWSMARGLLNVPHNSSGTLWMPGAQVLPWPTLLLSLAVLLLGLWLGDRRRKTSVRKADPRRVIPVAALLVALPGFATVFFVKHWAPYYACVPSIGMSIAAGYALARLPIRLAATGLSLFLLLGVAARGSEDGGACHQSERAWSAMSRDMEHIEHGMKSLRPTLPQGARVYVSVHLPHERWIHALLLRYQATGVWYGRSDIKVRPAGSFDPGKGVPVIFWISPGCDVFEITYPSLQVRTSGPMPDYEDYQSARRLLAVALFRAGRVDQAAGMIEAMRESDPSTRGFDRRLAAALYLTAGRRGEAVRALRDVPPVGMREALVSVASLLGPIGSREDFAPAALAVYGLPLDDPEVWRYLMRWFVARSEGEPAWRMARALLALRPRDREAKQVLQLVAAPRVEDVTLERARD